MSLQSVTKMVPYFGELLATPTKSCYQHLVNKILFDAQLIIFKSLFNFNIFLGVTMKTEEFNGAKNLLLKVQMSKGKGDLAWQHTQLFRTNLEDSNENSDAFQFRWIVHLKKDAS